MKVWRWLVWAFSGSAMLAAPMVSWAGWDTPTVTKLPSGAYEVTPSTRSLLREAWATERLVADQVGRSVVAGASLTVPVGAKSAPMVVGWKLTESAAGKLLARSLPVIGTATLAYEVAHQIRCYAAPGSTGWGGFLECDPGVLEETVTAWNSTSYAAYCSGKSSAQEVYTCEAERFYATNTYVGWTQWRKTRAEWIALGAPDGGSVSAYACTKSGASPPANWAACGARSIFNSGAYSGSATRCPSSVDLVDGTKSIPAGAPLGPDGKCRTARGAAPSVWVPATENDVAAKLPLLTPEAENLPEVVREAIKSGGEAGEEAIRALGEPSLTGPATVNGPTSTTTPPGGSPVTTTTVYNVTYEGNTYSYTTTTINGDGSQTTGDPVVPKVDVETCGLPGKPPCKMDESGTPTTGDYASATEAVEAAKEARTAQIEGAPSKTDLGWSWPLSLPSAACSPFTLYTPPEAGTTWTVDLCSSAMVDTFRALLAWLVASWTLLYVWRSVTALEQG